MTKTCNQCHGEFELYVGIQRIPCGVCSVPHCPNYGLLQVAAEHMQDERYPAIYISLSE